MIAFLFGLSLISYGELIGIQAESYDSLMNSGDLKYPLTISLVAEDTKEVKTMVIPFWDKLPKKSVSVECPNSKYKFEKCWFIKYDKE